MAVKGCRDFITVGQDRIQCGIQGRVCLIKVLDILVGGVTKQFDPFRGCQHAQVFRGAGDSSKLIIINHMVLGSNGSSGEVEAQSNSGGMTVADTNIDSAVRARLPPWKLLSILNSLIQNIGWASKHMDIMEFLQGPAGSCEDVARGQASAWIRNAVEEVFCMLDCHGPQRWVGCVGPVDSSMQHHSPGYGHDGSDGSLSFSIVVVGTNSSKLAYLTELAKFFGVLLASEGGTIVREVGLRHNSLAGTVVFKSLLSFKGFMGSQQLLEVNKDIVGGGVHKDASSFVPRLDWATPFGLKGASQGAADEVVY